MGVLVKDYRSAGAKRAVREGVGLLCLRWGEDVGGEACTCEWHELLPGWVAIPEYHGW
jgi:hypothetical protein